MTLRVDDFTDSKFVLLVFLYFRRVIQENGMHEEDSCPLQASQKTINTGREESILLERDYLAKLNNSSTAALEVTTALYCMYM